MQCSIQKTVTRSKQTDLNSVAPSLSDNRQIKSINTYHVAEPFNTSWQTKIVNQLELFKLHSLAEMERFKLMNRTDTKFLLPISLLSEILMKLTHDYSCLSINEQLISTYRNQYYDTANREFYMAHHNGKANRYKIRERHYVESDRRFLEIKLKNNKKRTIKTRLELFARNNINTEQFFRSQTGLSLSQFQVVQLSGYQRIALLNDAMGERLTLDFNLWYQRHSTSQSIRLKDTVIAELKQSKKSIRSPFFQLMKSYGKRTCSFSKYCIGNVLLSKLENREQKAAIKINRFKPQLRELNWQTA